jgi:hypothetical protein
VPTGRGGDVGEWPGTDQETNTIVDAALDHGPRCADRGLVPIPAAIAAFQENVAAYAEIAGRTGCRLLNALYYPLAAADSSTSFGWL